MTERQELQFEKDLCEFIQSEAWLPFNTPASYEALVAAAELRIEQNGGYSSYSSIELTAAELIRTGVAKRQFTTQEEIEEAEFANLTLDQFRRTPSATSQQMYRTNPRYKDAVDRLFAEESPEAVPPPAPAARSNQPAHPAPAFQLTAADYHALPSSVLQKKYKQDPTFAAAVDYLHATGQV